MEFFLFILFVLYNGHCTYIYILLLFGHCTCILILFTFLFFFITIFYTLFHNYDFYKGTDFFIFTIQKTNNHTPHTTHHKANRLDYLPCNFNNDYKPLPKETTKLNENLLKKKHVEVTA